MLIIPVIDIKAGRAVQAVGGRRDQYRPVATRLCNDSDPLSLLEAYLRLHPFSVIYVADLDAITGRGDNRALIDAMAMNFETPTFWLDAGFRETSELPGGKNRERFRIVLGSESLASLETYADLRAGCDSAPILSLDFRRGSFLGPEALLRNPAIWPDELIVMALDRVGGGQGPSLGGARQRAWMANHQVFAAGGVRGSADVKRLAAFGYSGVLVASALLDARIDAAELATMSGEDSRCGAQRASGSRGSA